MMSDVEPPSDEVEQGPETKPSSSRRRRTAWYAEWAVIIVLALLIAIGFRTYVAQTFFIPSTSMTPTLQVGDRIVVSKLSVTWGTINRGDIVVFKSPANVAAQCQDPPEAYLVKRVIGIPGDRLRNKGSKIFVNGKLLKETWRHSTSFGPQNIQPNELVPEGQYYMMGDNHAESCDSRYWGTVPAASIIGKVVFRIWPFSRFGIL